MYVSIYQTGHIIAGENLYLERAEDQLSHGQSRHLKLHLYQEKLRISEGTHILRKGIIMVYNIQRTWTHRRCYSRHT